MEQQKTFIIGAGIFGVTAAVELNRRGHEVHLFDQGPIPHPRASSTDITKMIRADYGADDFYTELMFNAFKGWDQWNREWPRPLYHQTGFLMMTKQKMKEGSLEMESMKVLREKGQEVRRLSPELIAETYPQWNHKQFADGYYNPRGGWAESGEVVAQLAKIARTEGVKIHENHGLKYLLENGTAVKGIITGRREVRGAGLVILAVGAWTPTLLPELSDRLRVSGQPVYMLQPETPERYRGEVFPGWSADISQTGWYGFPAQSEGLLKIANHGKGFEAGPQEEQDVPEQFFPKFQEFLAAYLPQLRDAPVVKTRLCLYCDSWDGDFYIDHHPERPGLMVATGGSGHGFKFAPVLGDLIADVAEGKENPFAHRFRWREKGEERVEAARYEG